MKISIMNKSVFLIILMCYTSVSTAANILAIFTLASPSCHIWHSPLVVALANRGHNVTVLSPEAQKTPVPNLTNLEMKELYQAVAEGYSYEDMTDLSPFYWISEAFVFWEAGCSLTLQHNAFKQLMNYPSDFKFDLIIMEPIGVECLFGILPKFGNPPIVVANTFSIPTWVLEMTGTPNVPSHIPHYFYPYTDHMTFTERAQNFLTTIYTHYLYHYNYLPNMDKAAAKYFGSTLRPAIEILKNVSLAMSNFHPALDYPWAMTPNLIPVAGIQIKDPKPLPTDIQKFLDEATEGAIFFSLGSNVRSDKLSAEKRKAILEAFAEIPQRVLWKFESDLTGLPKNVKIGKWLPQNDILAHPNVKVFLTHSGGLSTYEAIHRGVPVIGIPFIVDQHINIRKVLQHGCGVLLEYRDLTKESLLAALNKVIGDPSYRDNMKILSSRLRDNPQTPLERAVFWTEYVLRHKGAQHLQSAAKNLNFVQYFLLDVIAILLIVPALLIIVLYSLCCKRKSVEKRKQKKN